MKPETFFRKFANLPLEKRNIPQLIAGFWHTPLGIYRQLNDATERKNEAILEIERLLKIGEVILH